METESNSDTLGSESDSGPEWKFPFGMPQADNGITMVSPPESSLDELPNDHSTALSDDHEIFGTPTQNISTSNSTPFLDCDEDGMMDAGGLKHDGKMGSGSSKRAVDLGGDSKSGFSPGEEVDSAKKIRASRSGSSCKGKSPAESHFKWFERYGFESPSEPLGTDSKEGNVNNVTGLEKQNIHESDFEVGKGGVRQTNLVRLIHTISSDSDSEERNIGSDNNRVKASIKGKSLDFSTEGMECDSGKPSVECKNEIGDGYFEANTNTREDDTRARYTAGNGTDSSGMKEDFMKISLLDVLHKLEKDDLEEDRNLACLSLLEVAERRWGPF